MTTLQVKINNAQTTSYHDESILTIEMMAAHIHCAAITLYKDTPGLIEHGAWKLRGRGKILMKYKDFMNYINSN